MGISYEITLVMRYVVRTSYIIYDAGSLPLFVFVLPLFVFVLHPPHTHNKRIDDDSYDLL